MIHDTLPLTYNSRGEGGSAQVGKGLAQDAFTTQLNRAPPIVLIDYPFQELDYLMADGAAY